MIFRRSAMMRAECRGTRTARENSWPAITSLTATRSLKRPGRLPRDAAAGLRDAARLPETARHPLARAPPAPPQQGLALEGRRVDGRGEVAQNDLPAPPPLPAPSLGDEHRPLRPLPRGGQPFRLAAHGPRL